MEMAKLFKRIFFALVRLSSRFCMSASNDALLLAQKEYEIMRISSVDSGAKSL